MGGGGREGQQSGGEEPREGRRCHAEEGAEGTGGTARSEGERGVVSGLRPPSGERLLANYL